MAPTLAPDHRRARLAAALITLLFVAQALLFHGLRHDDAYITYRYGQNLADGHGLVFNPDQRILGTTAPGHALLAATVYRVVGKDALPTAMALLGCLGWTAQAVAVWWLLMPATGRRTAFFVAACVATGAAGAQRWLALETTLVLAATLWALVFALRDRWKAAAVACAVAGLLRPDAFLLPILLAPLAWQRLRVDLWRPAAIGAAIIAPWLLVATVYYGSPMPHTADAKRHATSPTAYAEHLLQLPARTSLDQTSAVATFGLWAFAVVGTLALVHRDRRLVLLPAYAMAHGLAYLYLRPEPDHGWHLHPSTTLIIVLALVGGTSILERAGASVVARKRRRRPLATTVMLLVVGACAVSTLRFAARYDTERWFGGRDHAYRQAAAYLRAHADPNDLVTGFEVGTLGYWSGLEMYDWSGLITRGPQFPSNRPNERWYVVDDGARHVPAGAGYRHAATFRHGTFAAHVYEKTTPP